MYTYNGKTIRVGRSWTDLNGITHPVNWASAWSDEYKAEIGLIFTPDTQPSFNKKFYWSAGLPKAIDDVPAVDENDKPILDEDGNQVVTKGLKTTLIATVKAQAGSLLKETDWLVTREAERNIPVPLSARAYRQAVADNADMKEAAIMACVDVPELEALYTSTEEAQSIMASWPKETDDFSAYVPQVVSMRQARLALHAAGLLGSVNAAVTLDPVNELEWNYATVVDRNSSLVTGIGVGLGLTDVQIDDLFRSAATL